MNFGEIYDAIALNVWGDSVPPASGLARLQGSQGIIANMCQDLMKDYNYWFMETWQAVTSIAGVQGYSLANNYKEITNCMWQVVDATATDPYFTDPLIVLSHGEAHSLWRDNNQRAEYPTHYEMQTGSSLILYPIPEEDDRELNVIYYRFLDRPDATTFLTDTDELTQNGAEAIIALSSAKMLRILQELQQANVYDGEARRQIDLLKDEDNRRRQVQLFQVQYRGF